MLAGPGRPPRATVLELVTRMNVGGPARQVLQLVRLAGEDLRVELASGRPPEEEGELLDPGVIPVRVPLVRALRPVTDLRAFGAVRGLLGRLAPAVVHTHMAKAGAVGRLAALSLRARPRLVHTFHGHVLEGYFPPLQQRAFLEAERLLARRTDALVAVSPEVRDELVELGVGRQAQYRVIPVGLDLGPFLAVAGPSGRLRGALGLGPEVPLVGALGRLVPIKDHETLLSALAGLPGVHLAVLGDGELRAVLEGRARALRIAGRVHFTGWWPDVPGALADLDVVALSSRNEGTPVALVEALAAARPVVATDVGGVGHVVQHGETGWLVAPGDPAGLASALGEALFDRARASRMAEEGRRRVSERFGSSEMVEAHRELYRELLRR
jgi:glycosyltransferase involved in cell wall biosynthesis